MKKISIIFGAVILAIIIIIMIYDWRGTSEKNLSKIARFSPMPHGEKEFIEISDRGDTTVDTCKAYGGREIFPINYEIINLIKNERTFVIKEKETGQIYECVYFSDANTKKFVGIGELITMDSCCWAKE